MQFSILSVFPQTTSIERDLCQKIEGIRARVEKIEEESGNDIGGYKSRLEEKLRAALADNNITIDESRILTECAIYADRAAIDEETVRLRSHFDAFYGYVAKELLLVYHRGKQKSGGAARLVVKSGSS